MDTQVAAGALLGTLVGDAIGAPWEGAPSAPARSAADRVEASLRRDVLPYTDDTQLTLALAEHLLEHPDVEPQALATTILTHYEDWRGYAGGMATLVAHWRTGMALVDAATSVFPDGSLGNGAAMRVAPVGVLHAGDLVRVTAAARRQAALTHAHPIGQDGAVVQACAVALGAHRRRFGRAEVEDLARLCETRPMREGLQLALGLAQAWAGDTSITFPAVAERLGNNVTAHGSVPAAVWIAATAPDVITAVEMAVGLGGDADTIAAMACAVLGAAHGPGAIPRAWLARMEDGPRGLPYTEGLARRLEDARLA